MKEYLYSVSTKNKRTGEKIELLVWAENGDIATGKLAGVLFGYYCEHEWTGTGPVHEDNEIVSREARS